MAVVKRSWTLNGFGRENIKNEVCVYWLKGKCNRNPCRFIHGDIPATGHLNPKTKKSGAVHSNQAKSKAVGIPNSVETKTRSLVHRKSPDPEKVNAPKRPSLIKNVIVRTNRPPASNVDKCVERERSSEKGIVQDDVPEKVVTQEAHPKQCKYWVTGNCVYGDSCKDMHSWFYGSGFQMLAKLEGNSQACTGIALPSGSDKLYTGSSDNFIRTWDCNSGQCVCSINANVEVRCLVTEGPMLFVGLRNGVKAWNSQTQQEFFLNAHDAIICSMDLDDDKFYAGMEDGSVYVWKLNAETISSDPISVLKGHTGAVCSVIVAGNCRLYTGSRDCTIKSWHRESLQCVQTLYGHASEVTSLLCWDVYLLSASLDKTIKVWAVKESHTIETIYERKEDAGVLALCGLHDSESKPVLLCSCSDNTVRLYDIPSFYERGRIFSKREVRRIHRNAPNSLFFTGDTTGEVFVWKMM